MARDDTAWLGERLRNGPAWSRKAPARALGKSGDAGAIAPLCEALKDAEIGDAAAEALARLGPWAVPALCEALKAAYGDVRWRLAEVLGKMGDDRAVAPLCDALTDPYWRTRHKAAEALVRIGDARAILPLCELLTDVDWRVRTVAAAGLTRIGDARAIPPLIGALQNRCAETSERAAVALGKLGDARAVAPLCEALAAGNDEAAWALEAIALRDPVPELRAAVPVLRCRLLLSFLTNGPEGRETAQAFRRVLARIQAATAVRKDLPLPVTAPLPSAEGLPLPATPPPTAVDGLPISAPLPLSPPLDDGEARRWGEALRSGPPWERHSYAEALGKSGDVRAIAPLCAALEDTEIGDAAAMALMQFGQPAVLPLCRALSHRAHAVRRRAAKALGALGDGRAFAPLCAALNDREWSVRAQAVEALGRLGDLRAVPLLVELLEQAIGTDTPSQAAVAPGETGLLAWPMFTNSCLSPEQVAFASGETSFSVAREGRQRRLAHKQAVLALEAFGPAAVLPLCAALGTQNNHLRRRAAWLLGRIADPRAVLPLCDALRQGEIEAAVALGEIATRAPAPELRAALPLLRERARSVPVTSAAEQQAITASREALRRIEAVTVATAMLPTPAAAPPPPTEALPLPAGPSEPAVESLPISAEPPAVIAGNPPLVSAEADNGCGLIEKRTGSPLADPIVRQGWWPKYAARLRWRTGGSRGQ